MVASSVNFFVQHDLSYIICEFFLKGRCTQLVLSKTNGVSILNFNLGGLLLEPLKRLLPLQLKGEYDW